MAFTPCIFFLGCNRIFSPSVYNPNFLGEEVEDEIFKQHLFSHGRAVFAFERAIACFTVRPQPFSWEEEKTHREHSSASGGFIIITVPKTVFALEWAVTDFITVQSHAQLIWEEEKTS